MLPQVAGVRPALAMVGLQEDMGIRVKGFGFRVQGLGFRVQGLGFIWMMEETGSPRSL